MAATLNARAMAAPAALPPNYVYGFSTRTALQELWPHIDRPLASCASALMEDHCKAAQRNVDAMLARRVNPALHLCGGRDAGFWVNATLATSIPSCLAWCSAHCRYRDYNQSAAAMSCLRSRWIHVAGDSTARALYRGLSLTMSLDRCARSNVSMDDASGRRAIGVLDDCTSTTVPGLRVTFMSRDMLWRMPHAAPNLTAEHHLNNQYLHSWNGAARQPDFFVFNAGLHEAITTWGGAQVGGLNMSRIVHDAAAFLRFVLDDADGARYRGRIIWFKGHHIKVGRRAKLEQYARIVSFYDAMQNLLSEMFAARGALISDLWQTTQFSQAYDGVGVHYNSLVELHANIVLNTICNADGDARAATESQSARRALAGRQSKIGR